jgi:hypothetical protein
MRIATQGLDPDDIIGNTDLDKITEMAETPTEDSVPLKDKVLKIDRSKIKVNLKR